MNQFFDPELVDRFVDREEEMSKLWQLVSFSADEKEKLQNYQRIIHLVGKSGVGKSFLLKKFGYELSEQESIFPLYINFEEYVSFTGEKIILKVLQSIDEKISIILKVRPQLNNASSQVAYSNWVLRGIEQIQREKTFVFLLDEVSLLSYAQSQLMEKYLLGRILSFPNVVAVLAGRHLITVWKEFALRPLEDINIIELEGFDFEHTQRQIHSITPHVDALMAEIHEISGGSPGNNKKILDQFNEPTRFSKLEAILACNKEFYEAVDDVKVKMDLPDNVASELLPALEALCVLEDFDKEYEMPVMLSAHPALSGDWTVQYCADVLNILYRVQVGPGKLVAWSMDKNALVIEEQTRFNLEKELMIRDKALWKTLHCTAMMMYANWTEKYGLESIFARKVVYHKSQLEKAGFNPSECNII